MDRPDRSWRADYASPVSKYFQKSGNEDVSKLLMENSADSLRTSLNQYGTHLPGNSNYKHAVLLLDHSVETLFKARLSLAGKTSILKARKDSSFLETLDFHECIATIETIGARLDDNHKMATHDLHDIRNDIWHFGFLGVKDSLDNLISFCACVYWVFLMKYMPGYGIRPMLIRHQFETLMDFEKEWHFATFCALELMNDWYQTLNVEQDQYFVRCCKECLVDSVIVDTYMGAGRCRCCGHEYK